MSSSLAIFRFCGVRCGLLLSGSFGRLLLKQKLKNNKQKNNRIWRTNFFCSATVSLSVQSYLIATWLCCFWFRLRMYTKLFKLSRRLAAVSKYENCQIVHIKFLIKFIHYKMLEMQVEFDVVMDKSLETYKKLPDEDSGKIDSRQNNNVSSKCIIN